MSYTLSIKHVIIIQCFSQHKELNLRIYYIQTSYIMNEEDSTADVSILLPILKNIALFQTLNDAQHHEIIAKITLMYYPANYKLIQENEEGNALYIIKNGQVEIFKESNSEDSEKTVLATLHQHDFFGEMSLISEVPRNASAKTLVESEIFILNKQEFKDLLNSNAVMAAEISEKVISRLKENEC